jgi:hypothetical protein
MTGVLGASRDVYAIAIERHPMRLMRNGAVRC